MHDIYINYFVQHNTIIFLTTLINYHYLVIKIKFAPKVLCEYVRMLNGN